MDRPPSVSHSVCGWSSAHLPLSTLPRIAVVGASSRSPEITSGPPMSPAWMIWSTPASRSRASGRRRPCVSEMMPIIMVDTLSDHATPLDDLEIVAVGQRLQRLARQGLVPEGDRGEVVLQGQVAALLVGAPPERLDGDAEARLEAHRVHDVPAVHPEA